MGHSGCDGTWRVTGEPDRLRRVLASADAVVFDFDGPLCDVFAGLPAWQVAQQLQKITGTHYDTRDPLEVLRRANEAAAVGQLHELEDQLIAAELAAVATSVVITEGVRALEVALDGGLRVGIVSNNSAPAVNVFIEHLGLAGRVHPVIGRAYRRPDLMKPNPWPMNQALLNLGIEPGRVAYVGDSMSDIKVARLVHMPCIAYANKPGKHELFAGTDAVVVDNMKDVADALAVRRDSSGSS
jgi:phosphoglycolate phosphatase-like HAD superfamily hydrolase